MIPPRKPPFGIGPIFRSIFDYSNKVDIECIEEAYAHAYGMPHAILLPSCRTGINWALLASIDPGTDVFCSAYTCRVVWEAIVRSGGKLNLIDLKADSFLMDEDVLSQRQVENHALVLCEIYGYTHNLSKIDKQSKAAPAVRIVDMAMTEPTTKSFERLNSNDFAVLSFGAGKCMYAGWGGIGLTCNTDLAAKIKKIRDKSIKPVVMSTFLRRTIKMIALNVMYKNFTYGLLKRLKDIRQKLKQHVYVPQTTDPSYLSTDNSLAPEWFLPATFFERNLMLYNLSHVSQYAERRLALADRYHEFLKDVEGVKCPPVTSSPMSHYTIRVKPELRPAICEYLSKSGIHADKLFDFPRSLSSKQFPIAAQTASEVVNLPLNVDLTTDDIEKISDAVVSGCTKCNSVADYRQIDCEIETGVCQNDKPSLHAEVKGADSLCSKLCDAWDDLFNRASDAPPYLSRPWVATFIDHKRLRGTPKFILVWHENKLVALLALSVRTVLGVKIAEPIGTSEPTYLGVLMDTDYPASIAHIAEIVVRKNIVNCLYNTNVSSEDQATIQMFADLNKRGFASMQMLRNPCHYIQLKNPFEAYLQKTKTGKRRRKLLYEERRLLNSGDVKSEHYHSDEIDPEVLSRIAIIQENSRMKKRGAAVLDQQFYQDQFLRIAKAGMAEAWIMKINDNDAAFVFTLVSHGKVHYYRTAYSLSCEKSLSVGKTLTMQVIRNACDSGIKLFDFGQGDGEYKRFWATDCNYAIRIAAGSGLRGYIVTVCLMLTWRLGRIKWIRSLYRKICK